MFKHDSRVTKRANRQVFNYAAEIKNHPGYVQKHLRFLIQLLNHGKARNHR
jgi:hypothetical protein